MDVFYINLAQQAERRAFVEDSFRAGNDRDWRLHRIEAITPRTPGVSGMAGTIRDVEKACFLSHIEAVRASRAHDGHALIAEDDIQFGQKSFATVETYVGDDAGRIVGTLSIPTFSFPTLTPWSNVWASGGKPSALKARPS